MLPITYTHSLRVSWISLPFLEYHYDLRPDYSDYYGGQLLGASSHTEMN